MSGHHKDEDEPKGPSRDFLRLSAQGVPDDSLITSSPRAKKKDGGQLSTPIAKRLNTGKRQILSGKSREPSIEVANEHCHKAPDPSQQVLGHKRIEELASPELKRREEPLGEHAKELNAEDNSDKAVGEPPFSSALLEAKSADPPRPPPDLPPEIPPPPIPQGRVREPTPEVGDAKQRGVLKSIFSPVFQLFQPGKQDTQDGKPFKTRALKARENGTPTRSRSRSPEEWSKVAEDDAEPVHAEIPKTAPLHQEQAAVDSVSPSDGAVRCRPAASDGASSTDGESDTCLMRSPAPAFREVKQGAESESESETGEETCAADLAAVPVNEEEDGDDLYEFAFDPYSFIKSLPPLENCVPAWRRALLPKQTRNCKRKTLVLDLDETLVHSTLDFGEAKTDFMFEVSLNNKKHCVNVRQRPHMTHFLQRCAELFELVIFTASQKLYAEQLLNIIDPGRKLIRHRIYRDSCLFVEGNYLKDLTLLGRDLAHTLIIDNSPQAFGFQLANGVPIESWYDDDSDDELLRMLPFLEKLVDVPDVRPYIINAFKLHTLVDQAPGYA